MWSQRLGGLGLGLLPTRSAYQLLFKTRGLREDLEPWTASSFLPDSEQFHTRILSLRDLVLFCFLPPLLLPGTGGENSSGTFVGHVCGMGEPSDEHS